MRGLMAPFCDRYNVTSGSRARMGTEEASGKYTVRFYAIVYNLSASVEPQSAPSASKRFGAILPGHFFTNALLSKRPVC